VFQKIGLSDIVDVGLMSFLIYIVLVWFKKTRAAFVLTGIIIIAAVYLIAQQFNLVLTAWVFQGFFAVILLALVIIFQEEIRRFFEQVALFGVRPRLRRRRPIHLPPPEVEALVRTVSDLARQSVGAIVVIKGKNMLVGHLDSGTELGGKLSEPLLKSIFDPHSAGHDGAVIVEEDRITQFGAHLPLSKNFKRLEHRGTRHAAALGISELTDALCIVISEETGDISIARHGEIRKLPNVDALLIAIERFYHEISPRREASVWKEYVLKNYKEKAVAIGLALMLWFVHVYGSEVIYKSFKLPVQYAELPEHMEIDEINPKEVEVTFSGTRRDLYFLRSGAIKIFLNTLDIKRGAQTIPVVGSDVMFPKNINLEDIDPSRVRVQVRDTEQEKDEGGQ